ncbi:MAG: VOC family protein [Thermoanaerobaculia bacterium]|nr:VOC family protein [Thermoanaerobaculia bacterium]
MNARYSHTNLIARDWRALAQFYERVFACTPVPPERNYSGNDLEAGTGVENARLRGVHLLLPGHGERGPTLEIYQYEPEMKPIRPEVNRNGFAHIAFEVDDVAAARQMVVENGGTPVGEIVTLKPGDRSVTWCYLRDPEGNIVELQSWSG